ncbi:MAG: serine hydrolase domain-containing protein, partial [Gemmatimonadota bacterium]|nr:serine hydrolase domain-containing protein [Gemmatimonadota bacterium]
DTLAFAGGYGLADREAATPIRPGTFFALASLTKPFTAAAVLKLAERGELALEDPLSRHLDGLCGATGSITLHQLLTHTSGLPENPPETVQTRADLERALASVELEGEPGTDFEYGNYGYVVAAAVIEEVSGEPYRSFVEREVIAPAGDLALGFWPDPDLPDSLAATGYTGFFGSGRATEPHPPAEVDWTLLGASGLWGSLPDLWRWARALRAGEIVSPESVESIFAPHVNDYGYGWFLWETPRGSTEVIHGGDTEGFQSYLAFFDGEGFALAVAVNDQRGWRGPVYGDLVRLVVDGEAPELPPPTVEPRPADLRERAGRWTLPGDGVFEVEAVEEGLLIGAAGQRAAALLVSADEETVERLEAVNDKTERFVHALAEGDSTSVREILEPSGRAKDFFDVVWSRLAGGRTPDGFEVLGSVPARAGRDVAFVRLRFGDEEETLRLVWRPNLDGWGTGGEMPKQLFRPVGGDGYASFDLFTREIVRIGFEEGRLRFPGAEGATATRP